MLHQINSIKSMIYLKSMDTNMKTINTSLLAIILALFVACDGVVYVEVYIDNESDYDLELHYRTGGSENESNMTVQVGTHNLIHSYEIGAIHAELYSHIKYVELYYQDLLVYDQNPIMEKLWDTGYTDNDEGIMYTLIIRNEDLDINDN